MKRFVLALALACALSGSVLAGDGHTVGSPAPGDMGNGGNQARVDDGNQGAGGLALLILDLLF